MSLMKVCVTAWWTVCLLHLVLAQSPTPSRVLILGIDGWSDACTELVQAPNLAALRARGSYAPMVRTVWPPDSLASWASVLYGSPPTVHGVRDGSWNTCQTKFPSLFDVLRQARPDSASVALTSPESRIADLLDARDVGAMVALDDGGFDGLAFEIMRTQRPDLMFVHYGSVNEFGKRYGWCSGAQLDEMEDVDWRIGELLQAVNTNETVVMVVSDHGGLRKSHDQWALPVLEAPMIIAGPGIRSNHTVGQQLMVSDTAHIAARILGLAVPAEWHGVVPEEVFGATAPGPYLAPESEREGRHCWFQLEHQENWSWWSIFHSMYSGLVTALFVGMAWHHYKTRYTYKTYRAIDPETVDGRE